MKFITQHGAIDLYGREGLVVINLSRLFLYPGGPKRENITIQKSLCKQAYPTFVVNLKNEFKGPFNKYVTVDGEGVGSRDP